MIKFMGVLTQYTRDRIRSEDNYVPKDGLTPIDRDYPALVNKPDIVIEMLKIEFDLPEDRERNKYLIEDCVLYASLVQAFIKTQP